MRRSVLFMLAVWAAVDCAAVSHLGFELAAFEQACSKGQARSVAFSPLSFELDSIVFAEASDTLTRAHTMETIGVLMGFDVAYQPVFDAFDCQTNRFSLLMARGFCLQRLNQAQPALVQLLQSQYRTEVCRMSPKDGAQAWFRTAMEGKMEDFTPVVDMNSDHRYAFYDLVSLGLSWDEPFPTNNTRRLTFIRADGTRVKRDFMTDIRPVDLWESKTHTQVRLPLKGGADIHFFLPKAEFTLADVMTEIRNVEPPFLCARPRRQPGSKGVPGAALVGLPKMEVRLQNDLLPVMGHFRFPVKGLKRLVGESVPSQLSQIVRFRLAEQGPDEVPMGEKPVGRQIRAGDVTAKLLFNRPFVFFVHHKSTETIPLAVQYFGED